MIGIDEKLAEKNDLKKAERPSVYRGEMAISPTLLCYILLWFMARDMDRGEGESVFSPEIRRYQGNNYKFYCNIKSLASSPSYG